MQIIKSLNLNKTPASVKSGSLIFAKNIKVSKNGYSIIGEEGVVDINYIPDELKNSSGINWFCVGCIETSKELILFLSLVQGNNLTPSPINKSYIVRYKEDEDKSYLVPCNWQWSGGDIDGAYYYNAKDQLIIAIAEHPKDKSQNIEVPLKMINLDDCSINDDESIYTLTPNVPFANLVIGKRTKTRIPQGVYQFFIRYKLKKNRYTNWFPLGVPVYAVNRENKSIVNVAYQLQTGVTTPTFNKTSDSNSYFDDIINNSSAPTYELKSAALDINVNNINLDAYSFMMYLNFYNRQDNITEYQIGFILQGESGQVGRIWKEFKIPTTTEVNHPFVFKYPKTDNLIEVDPKEFLNPIYNLYNVENVETFDNRFYFSNFKETQFNVTNPLLQQKANEIKVSLQKLTDLGHDDTITTKGVIAHITRYTPVFDISKPLNLAEAAIDYNTNHIKQIYAYSYETNQTLDSIINQLTNKSTKVFPRTLLGDELTIQCDYETANINYMMFRDVVEENGTYTSKQYPNIVSKFNNYFRDDVTTELEQYCKICPVQRIFVRINENGYKELNYPYEFYLQSYLYSNWKNDATQDFEFVSFSNITLNISGTDYNYNLYRLYNGSTKPTTLQEIFGGFEHSSNFNSNIKYSDIAAFNINIPEKYNWDSGNFKHTDLKYDIVYNGKLYQNKTLSEIEGRFNPTDINNLTSVNIHQTTVNETDLYRAIINYIVSIDNDINDKFVQLIEYEDDSNVEILNAAFYQMFGLNVYDLIYYRPTKDKNINEADAIISQLQANGSDKIVNIDNVNYIKISDSIPLHIIEDPSKGELYNAYNDDNNSTPAITAFSNTQYMYVPIKDETTLSVKNIIKCDGMQLFAIDEFDTSDIVNLNTLEEKLIAIKKKLIDVDYTVSKIGEVVLVEDTIYRRVSDTVHNSTTDIVFDTNSSADNYSIVPHQAYNIFVHYVRADGSSTNGIPIRNYDAYNFINSIKGEKLYYPIDAYNKLQGDPNKSFNQIGLKFENINIPKGYVGCFFSMEKVDWQFNFTGIRPIGKKDILATEINLGKAFVDSDISYKRNNGKDDTGRGSGVITEVYDSNVINNVGQNAKFKLDNTLDMSKQSIDPNHNAIYPIKWGGKYLAKTNHNNSYGAVIATLQNESIANPTEENIENYVYDLYNSDKKVLIPLSGYYMDEMQTGTLDNRNCIMNYQGFVAEDTIFDISNYAKAEASGSDNESPTNNYGMLFDTSGKPVTPTSNLQQNNSIKDDDTPAGITPYISTLKIDSIRFIKPSRLNLEAVNIHDSFIKIASVFLQWGNECIYNCVKLANGFVVPDKQNRSEEDLKQLNNGTSATSEKEIRYANEKIALNQWVDVSQWGSMYELKDYFIDKHLLTYTNVRDKYNTGEMPEYNNFLRRTAIFQNEAYNYSFMNVFADDYKIISNAKGIITRLTSLGNNLLIHTEHSLYTIAGVNGLVNKTGQTIDVSNLNLFEQAVQEIFSSKLGFGGLQDKNAAITNYAGYTFYDNDNKSIYNIDGDKGFTIISSPVENILKALDVDKVRFANDIDNNRLLICINTKDNKYLTLSYSYILKEFISLHDYRFNYAYNTKQKCYLANDKDLGFYKLFDNNSTTPNHTYSNLYDTNNLYPVYYKDDCNFSIVDIIFNENFEIPKVLNSIHWVFKVIRDENKGWDSSLNSILLAEEPSDFDKPGDYIRIYSDTCSTDLLDISDKANNYSLNQTGYDKKPYFDRGMWNMNYFRNILNKLKDSNGRQYLSDDNSLIYGKYFVLRFVIDRRNKFKLDNASINISLR